MFGGSEAGDNIGQAPCNSICGRISVGKEYHSYCLCHLTENFLKEAGKHGIYKEATKQILKEMLYRVAYTLIVGEYNVALEELRCYKAELGTWVEDNELEQWAASKFTKERWG